MSPRSWIWNSPTWPRLTYDAERLAGPLRAARMEIGRLLGRAEAITTGDLSLVQRDVWSGEAVATSAIEGESVNFASVRSSVARRLGLTPDTLTPAARSVEGLLDVMENATAEWDADLTHERLCQWQASLFPAGGSVLRTVEVGRYRTHTDPMQIVSGPVGRETVHYEAPPSAAVRAEMQNFLDWFNGTRGGTLDGILRAALAHVWFESIHPFADGNGRVGRAIVDLALAQDLRQPTRLHGVAAEMQRRQAEYYDELNRAQRGTGEVTPWLAWFTHAVTQACRAASLLIEESLARGRFWVVHRDIPLNERQRKVVNRMLEAGPGRFTGGLTQRKYVGMTGTSRATAIRDIGGLVSAGLLVPGQAAGRSTYYDLAIPGWEWRGPPS
ncbi:MAG: Fic family protein [Steroidobacteraceae bacterium]|nr:Fic family protein [Steroidobacteraceae bacterium]